MSADTSEESVGATKMFFRQAIARALAEEMDRDPRALLLGQDIAEFGGSYKETVGLVERFGKTRVRNMPVAEAAIIGVAVGAAAAGLRPVAFITYMDFVMLGLDPLVNYAAKVSYKTGGQLRAPVVVKTTAGAKGQGVAHSQALEAWLLNVPGIAVVVPSTAGDAYGLLKTAMRAEGPVVFIDHKRLFPTAGFVPDAQEPLPFGRAIVRRRGEHVTIVAYSYLCGLALKAAERLESEGVRCEVLDPRTLYPLDLDAIVASVRRTGRLLTVEEGQVVCGVGAEICYRVREVVPEAHVERLGARRSPVSSSAALEAFVVPDVDRIADAARACASRRPHRQ
jgi:pyruvate/2-oxoglutarate/acetoin dehydrogenase E1 component